VFFVEKGYGFISLEGHRKDIYFSRHAVPPKVFEMWNGQVPQGSAVEFDLAQMADGKPIAKNLSFSGVPGAEAPPTLAQAPGDVAAGIENANAWTCAVGTRQRFQGTVRAWNETSGYGFIDAPGLSRDIWFSKHDTHPGLLETSTFLVGRQVSFELRTSRDGKPQASAVTAVDFVGSTQATPGSVGGLQISLHKRLLGEVRHFDAASGDGMIATTAGASSVEAHFSLTSLSPEVLPTISLGSKVIFSLSQSADGKLLAERILPAPGEEEALTGTVKNFNTGTYGFLTCDTLQCDLYFPREEVLDDFQASRLEGAFVEFRIRFAADARLQARSVRILRLPPSDGIPHLGVGTADAQASGVAAGQPGSGMIATFRTHQNFGFIRCGMDRDLYFHRNEVPQELQAYIIEGTHVTFEFGYSPDGKARARRVRPTVPAGVAQPAPGGAPAGDRGMQSPGIAAIADGLQPPVQGSCGVPATPFPGSAPLPGDPTRFSTVPSNDAGSAMLGGTKRPLDSEASVEGACKRQEVQASGLPAHL